MCTFYFQTWKTLENEMSFDMFVTGLRFQELSRHLIILPKKTLPVLLSVWQSLVCSHLKPKSNMVKQSNYLKVENGQTSHKLYLLTVKVCVHMQIIENC